MSKYLLLILTLILLSTACTNTVEPLPPEAKKTNTPCTESALQLGGTCYSAPTSYNETITWYENKAKNENWTFKSLTDDEPFSFLLATNDMKATLILFRQADDKTTGILIRTE